MKKWGWLALVFFLANTPSMATQRAGDQGLGLMIGNPSGLSGKFWLENNLAFDAAVGVARSEFDLHVSLLIHNEELPKNLNLRKSHSQFDMPVYWGIGPRVLFERKTEVGIRFPVGFSILPHRTRWEIFAEFAPVFRFTPSTGFNADFALGVRYYFKAVRPRVTD